MDRDMKSRLAVDVILGRGIDQALQYRRVLWSDANRCIFRELRGRIDAR
jgi:hypothetical protein